MTIVQSMTEQNSPKEKIYFELLSIGQCYQFGEYKITEKEITKFAL